MRQISLWLLTALGLGRPCIAVWDCSGAPVWGCKISQSCVGSPVTIPKQEMLSQAQTMVQQMGMAENHQVVTACSSCSTHSPAAPLAAIPGVGRSSPADLCTLLQAAPWCHPVPRAPTAIWKNRAASWPSGPREWQGQEPSSGQRLQHSVATLMLGKTRCYVHQVL